MTDSDCCLLAEIVDMMVSRRTVGSHSYHLDSLDTFPGGCVSAMREGRQESAEEILLYYLLAVWAVLTV